MFLRRRSSRTWITPVTRWDPRPTELYFRTSTILLSSIGRHVHVYLSWILLGVLLCQVSIPFDRHKLYVPTQLNDGQTVNYFTVFQTDRWAVKGHVLAIVTMNILFDIALFMQVWHHVRACSYQTHPTSSDWIGSSSSTLVSLARVARQECSHITQGIGLLPSHRRELQTSLFDGKTS